MKKQLLRLIAALVMLAILGSVLVFASDTQTGIQLLYLRIF